MDKTIQTHISRIKAGHFTKSEVGALTKIIASRRFATPERREAIDSLTETMEYQESFHIESQSKYHKTGFRVEPLIFAEPCTITPEQTEQGKVYLTRRYVKNNGQPRKIVERELNPSIFEIVKDVSHFEFVGVLEVSNDYSVVQVLPVYRTFDTSGNHFDYAPIHWGAPVIMQNLAPLTKPRKMSEPADLFKAPDMTKNETPDGFEEVAVLFCDSSGFGRAGEAALTQEQALAKAQELLNANPGGLYAGLTGMGQFQVYVTVWKAAA